MRGVSLTITAIIILLFTATYWLLRSRDNDKRKYKKVRPASGTRSPYLATSISSKKCGCSAVKEMGNTRFLTSGTVPKLPLAECSAARCDCKYVRHQDRRSTQGDRRAIYSLQTDMYALGTEPERRERKGRRDSDWSSGDVPDLQYRDFEWNT